MSEFSELILPNSEYRCVNDKNKTSSLKLSSFRVVCIDYFDISEMSMKHDLKCNICTQNGDRRAERGNVLTILARTVSDVFMIPAAHSQHMTAILQCCFHEKRNSQQISYCMKAKKSLIDLRVIAF